MGLQAEFTVILLMITREWTTRCRRATSRPETVEPNAYAEFRAGLLRHIGLEEKILLSAARAARDARSALDCIQAPAPSRRLTALLVATANGAIVGGTRAILELHNRLEESPGWVMSK